MGVWQNWGKQKLDFEQALGELGLVKGSQFMRHRFFSCFGGNQSVVTETEVNRWFETSNCDRLKSLGSDLLKLKT